jgi:hypothetical protein
MAQVSFECEYLGHHGGFVGKVYGPRGGTEGRGRTHGFASHAAGEDGRQTWANRLRRFAGVMGSRWEPVLGAAERAPKTREPTGSSERPYTIPRPIPSALRERHGSRIAEEAGFVINCSDCGRIGRLGSQELLWRGRNSNDCSRN